MQNNLDLLLGYVNAGLSPIPVDVLTKSPLIKEWQKHRSTTDEVNGWLENGHTNFGIVCGEPSGNLEIIDFDDYHLPGSFEEWKNLLSPAASETLKLLSITRTQHGGYHVLYRAKNIERNKKLALRPYDIALDGEPEHVQKCGPNCDSGDGCKAKQPKAFIETRGEGGQAVEPPSSGYLVLQGDFTNIPIINGEVRDEFFLVARILSQVKGKENAGPDLSVGLPDSTRPGDDFNVNASWDSILIPHGWKKYRKTGDITLWTRQGKASGPSAATNYYGNDQLHVFSSNAHPFEAEKSYKKFTAYTLLNYGSEKGDFSTAARELSKQSVTIKSEPVSPATQQLKPVSWRKINAEVFPVDRWRVQNLIPKAGVVILASISGEGKTWVALEIAKNISTGTAFLDTFETAPAKVLYIDAENSKDELQRRGRQLGFTDNESLLFLHVDSLNLNEDKTVTEILNLIENEKIGAVFIDTFRAVGGGIKEEKAEEIRTLFNRFKPLKEKGVVMVWLDHFRKPDRFDKKVPQKEHLFGSQDKAASVEVVLMLKNTEDGFITMYQRKNRLGKEQIPFRMKMEDNDENTQRRTTLAYAGEVDEKDSAKDEVKLLIPSVLVDGGKTTSEIIEIFRAKKLGQKNVRMALNELREQGVLDSMKQGRSDFYFLQSIADDSIEAEFNSTAIESVPS